MANEIKDKYSSSAPFNIPLDGLTGITGVGVYSDFVDNSSSRYRSVMIYAKLTQSGTLTGNKAGYVYGLRADASGHRTDGAQATTGSLTFLNAPLLGVMTNKVTPAAGDAIYGEFLFDTPGPSFAVGVSQDMCSTLTINSTGFNWVRWVGVNPEVQ